MYSIELGKKERNIRFDFNALCDLETKAEMGIMKMMDEYAGLNTIRLLIWAGCKNETKGLTLDMVGLWIQEYLENGGELHELYDGVVTELANSGVLGKQKQKIGKKGN